MLALDLRILILCEKANHSCKGANPRSDGANCRSKKVNINLRILTLILILYKKANLV